MIDPCPHCHKDRALVGKVHNCRPVQEAKPAAKPKRKKPRKVSA